MIKIVLLLSLIYGFSAYADKDCSNQAEQYLHNVGYSQPGQLREIDSYGLLHYFVRTNLNGGEAMYEVVVDKDCKYIREQLIWSE